VSSPSVVTHVTFTRRQPEPVPEPGQELAPEPGPEPQIAE